ncbi:CU044_5270 family protein [Nonomuraea sp. LPB2021202275-12-8]|uniref:CU044_5270 family protein n=1 Tax=Nonomuraea sp. LPB2021202275-12-8 TaxID=3120159 RepID=UPI00300CE397
MDELVRDLYGEPGPDPQGRARVWRQLAARRRRRRLSWLAAPVVAAALAMVLVVYGAPGQEPSSRSILLAAATTAESSAADGTYWHVKKLYDGTRESELWATRDGRAWTAEQGRVTRVTGKSPFSMAGQDLTYAQIQNLPSDPAALRERVTAMLPDARLLADALSGLLWTKPSLPAVRAAAYRALADLSEVRYLGARTDTRGRHGEAFSFGLPSGVQRTLIIDPVTSQVLSCTDDRGGRTEIVLVAGWTDEGPR